MPGSKMFKQNSLKITASKQAGDGVWMNIKMTCCLFSFVQRFLIKFSLNTTEIFSESQLFILDINTVKWRAFCLNLPPFFWEISHVSPAFQKRSQLTSGFPSLQSKRKRYEYEPKHFSLSSPQTKLSELFYTLILYCSLCHCICQQFSYFYHFFSPKKFLENQWRWKNNILSHVSHTKPVLFYYLLCIILHYIELTLFYFQFSF